MKKKYLEDGNVVYVTGAWLRWSEEKLEFEYVGADPDCDIFFEGKEVDGIASEKPFIYV